MDSNIKEKMNNFSKFRIIFKRVLGFFCVVIMLASINIKVNANMKNTQTNVGDALAKLNSVKLVTDYPDDTIVEEMDTVTFGSYPQDDIYGNIMEPIEWIVLDRKDGKALLLSKYILDYRQYTNAGFYWYQSLLRKWLNEDFYDRAFTDDEKNAIDITSLSNVRNLDPKTSIDQDTKDKIFCLGKEECMKYFGIKLIDEIEKFDYENEEVYTIKVYSNSMRLATGGSKYARNIGLSGEKMQVCLTKDWFYGNSDFWLRYLFDNRSCVSIVGGFASAGYSKLGVRPAMWVKYE